MNTITTQREQRRIEAVRAAEWATDVAGACAWWASALRAVDATTDSRRMIGDELLAHLKQWGKRCEENAAHHNDRAATITSNLTAAARAEMEP